MKGKRKKTKVVRYAQSGTKNSVCVLRTEFYTIRTSVHRTKFVFLAHKILPPLNFLLFSIQSIFQLLF